MRSSDQVEIEIVTTFELLTREEATNACTAAGLEGRGIRSAHLRRPITFNADRIERLCRWLKKEDWTDRVAAEQKIDLDRSVSDRSHAHAVLARPDRGDPRLPEPIRLCHLPGFTDPELRSGDWRMSRSTGNAGDDCRSARALRMQLRNKRVTQFQREKRGQCSEFHDDCERPAAWGWRASTTPFAAAQSITRGGCRKRLADADSPA